MGTYSITLPVMGDPYAIDPDAPACMIRRGVSLGITSKIHFLSSSSGRKAICGADLTDFKPSARLTIAFKLDRKGNCQNCCRIYARERWGA
jgi:hypothetical protein